MSHSLFRRFLSISEWSLARLLEQLSSVPGFILLDSANAKNHQFSEASSSTSTDSKSQFTLIAWQPVAIIETRGQLSSVTFPKNKSASEFSLTDDPLSLVEKELHKLAIKEVDDLPFCGGALGYWGYELGGRFERLPTPQKDELNTADMMVGVYESGLVVNHDNQKVEFFSQAPDAKQQWDDLLKHIKTIATLESNAPAHLSNSYVLTSDWSSNMTEAEYSTKFSKVKEYLRSGDCYQINLAQRFKADYKGNEWHAYLALRSANKAPFSSFIRTQESAILSLSPERFLQVNNGEVETKPIKGTRPRSSNVDKDKALANELASAPKDRAENLMIVDLLRNDIAKVSKPGSVKVPKLFHIESYPAVHHLVSTITSSLKTGSTSIDLLRGAFPGGSITGAPKIRAMEIIHELEPNKRSVYCGSVGYIKANGDMDTNITIRTLVCYNNVVYCWAGGGLVFDSICELEYQETWDKVNKILPVLSNLRGR